MRGLDLQRYNERRRKPRLVPPTAIEMRPDPDEDPLHAPRGRADRCDPCDRRFHGECAGGVCTCPVLRCVDGRGGR